MQIFHLKQCNEVEDGRVNITFHAVRDASEVFVNVFSQTIKATPLHQFMTQAYEFVLYRFVYSLVTVYIRIQEKNAHVRLF